MNKKAYSILFSALLASTFVHEIRTKSASKPSSGYQKVLERATEPIQTCELQCHYSNTTTNVTVGLNIIVNATIFVAVNTTANVALVIDIESNILLLINGNTGVAVLIDLTAKTGIFIAAGVWLAAKVTIVAFIATLNLNLLRQTSGAISFTVSSASSTILKAVNDIVQDLQIGISVELKANAKAGLAFAIKIALSLIAILKGDATGLYKLVGIKAIVTLFDLGQLVAFLQGLSVIIKALGGVTAIIAAGIVISLEALAKAQTGLEVLIILILQIGLKLDISKSLGTILNSVGGFFNLTAQLGGNSFVGVNGVITVVAVIIAFIDGYVSLDVVISALIHFVVYRGSATNLAEILNGLLSTLLDVLVVIKATASLSVLVTTIKAILNGTFIYKGVNISAIIKILTSAFVGILLTIVVAVLLELTAVVAISISIPRLLLVLILYLNTAIGVFLLNAIGIIVVVSVGVSGNIIASILSSIGNIVSLLLGGIYNFLVNLSVIGTIVKTLDTSVSTASNGTSSLKALVTASVSLGGLIRALIQVTLGISVGASAQDVATIKALIQLHSAVEIIVGVQIGISV